MTFEERKKCCMPKKGKINLSKRPPQKTQRAACTCEAVTQMHYLLMDRRSVGGIIVSLPTFNVFEC